MIKQHCVDQVLEASNIEEVVGEFVELKKKGVSYSGCCPFHNEKTPSFIVTPAKGIYKCFGCGVAGGSVKFLMEHKLWSFPETIKFLGKKFNITIEESDPPSQRDRIVKEREIEFKEKLFEFNQWTTDFYKKQLTNGALKYVEERFSKEMIEQFKLGFASDQYNLLAVAAVKKGYSEEFILSTGLIRKSAKDNLYDFFRNRIMFPIFDQFDRIISFSGRALPKGVDDKKYAKYLNLPDTPLYNKSNVLYGINYAIKPMSKYKDAILVEGNPDVIKMHQHGISNTIAPCGTALTIGQIKIIKRYADKIIMIYDGDEAGQKSIVKYAKLCISHGLNTDLAVLPKDQDPASFFESLDHWKEWYKENKTDFISFYSALLFKESENNPVKINNSVVDLAKLLFNLDPGSRSVYVDQISARHKVKVKLFTDALKSLEPVKSVNQADKELPEGVSASDFQKWGFYTHKNQYYFETKYGVEKVSNFVMKPVFHIENVYESRRVYELTNYYGRKVMADFDMTEMTSLQAFQRHVEGLGNFLFLGTSGNFAKLKLKLYEETTTCLEIKILGWQRQGFWAWSNGIISDGKFLPLDENGIVNYGDENYFVPAFSKIYIKDVMLFKDERKFRYIAPKSTLSEWSSLFNKVFGDNAILATSFWIAAIFRDHILHLFKNFPILNLFGPKGSGKSQLAMSMSCLFGEQQTPFNIHNGTKPGLAEHIQLFRNALAWVDEYKNNIDYDKVETLKSIYDSIGRTRMNMDKGKKKETTEVNSAVILSGQEMPTADVALFSRTMFLRFLKSEFTDEEKANYDALKTMERNGLSHLTSEIVKHRDAFEKQFYDAYLECVSELQDKLGDEVIEDRILRNFASAVASFKVINQFVTFPFSLSDLLTCSVSAIVAQNDQIQESNEIGKFWNLFESILDENLITSGWEFRIDFETRLKTKDKKNLLFPQGKSILKFKYNVIYSLYAKQSKARGEKPLPPDTLLYYLKNHKYYIGVLNSTRFTITEYDQESGGRIKKSQTTSAYCFDYVLLGINLEREPDSPAVEATNGHKHPDAQLEPAVSDKKEDNLPF